MAYIPNSSINTATIAADLYRIRTNKHDLEVHVINSPSVWDPPNAYAAGLFFRNNSSKLIKIWRKDALGTTWFLEPGDTQTVALPHGEELPEFEALNNGSGS